MFVCKEFSHLNAVNFAKTHKYCLLCVCLCVSVSVCRCICACQCVCVYAQKRNAKMGAGGGGRLGLYFIAPSAHNGDSLTLRSPLCVWGILTPSG